VYILQLFLLIQAFPLAMVSMMLSLTPTRLETTWKQPYDGIGLNMKFPCED
jgi:hypothetical protein